MNWDDEFYKAGAWCRGQRGKVQVIAPVAVSGGIVDARVVSAADPPRVGVYVCRICHKQYGHAVGCANGPGSKQP